MASQIGGICENNYFSQLVCDIKQHFGFSPFSPLFGGIFRNSIFIVEVALCDPILLNMSNIPEILIRVYSYKGIFQMTNFTTSCNLMKHRMLPLMNEITINVWF